MVVANLSAASDADAPAPSHASLSGLDAVNLFLAGALSGFGPYVAVFLAEQRWTEQKIGFVLTYRSSVRWIAVSITRWCVA